MICQTLASEDFLSCGIESSINISGDKCPLSGFSKMTFFFQLKIPFSTDWFMWLEVAEVCLQSCMGSQPCGWSCVEVILVGPQSWHFVCMAEEPFNRLSIKQWSWQYQQCKGVVGLLVWWWSKLTRDCISRIER